MIVDPDSPLASFVPILPAQLPGLTAASLGGQAVLSTRVQACAEVCAGRVAADSGNAPNVGCAAQHLARINTCPELMRAQVGCRSCEVDASGMLASPFVGPRWACYVVPHRHLSCYRAPERDSAAALATVAGVVCVCS